MSKMFIPGHRATSVNLSMVDGRVSVSVSPQARVAQVTLRTDAESGPCADAIRDTEFGERLAIPYSEDHVLHVAVPEVGGSSASVSYRGNNVSVRASGRGSIAAAGSIVFASTGSVTIVNGRVVTAAGAQDTVTADVVLPPDGQIFVKTVSADVELSGTIPAVYANTVSGDITAHQVGLLGASSTSGDIGVGRATGVTNIRTTSGDITLDSYTGGSALIGTVSGAILVTCEDGAKGPIGANSVSGRIRIRGAAGRVDPTASSVSGKVSVQ